VVNLGLQALATQSAYRQPDLSFELYFRQTQIEFEAQKKQVLHPDSGDYKSVMDSAIPVNDFKNDLVAATLVSDAKLLETFQFLRDKRDYIDESNFKRRLTWLFPDDGCYVRSALMQNMLKSKINETWSQIFVFGDLSLKTKYKMDGLVTWWYHVAPIVRTSSGIFVLDAGVNPGAPTPLLNWLTAINAETNSTIAICASNAYVPGSYCNSETIDHSSEAQQELRSIFLENEWDRLLDLGLLPEEMLGDNPPWKKTLAH
jgi:hypothetical protein